MGKVDHVRNQLSFDADRIDRGLSFEQFGEIGHRFKCVHTDVPGLSADDLDFVLGFGVAEVDPHHEAVELAFRKGVGAGEVERVLGGDDKEGVGQFVRVAVDGDPAFFHALEQSGLGSRRGAVQFVRDQDAGEDGSGAKGEGAGLWVVELTAEDVGGQHVRSALDALKGEAEALG